MSTVIRELSTLDFEMSLQYLIFALFYSISLPNTVYCDEVYISPTSNCSYSYCLTISQFVAGFGNRNESNTTYRVILLPGNHDLKYSLTVRKTYSFSIVADSNIMVNDVSLTCAEQVNLKFISTLKVNISGVTFFECTANEVTDVDHTTLEESVFTSLGNTPGSAFTFTRSSVNILRTSVTGSSLSTSSTCRYTKTCPTGTIISLNSTIKIFESIFEANRAIYAEKSNIILVNCNFSHHSMDHKSQVYGSAIFSNGSSVVISECNFIGNGKMHVNGNLKISRGGGVAVIDSSILINKTNFVANSAYVGGALYVLRSTVLILSTNFFQNRAFSTGAGLCIISCKVQVNNSNFMFSIASQSGALTALSSIVFLHNNKFYKNAAQTGNGGAIKVSNSSVAIFWNIVINNNAMYNGGGVYATHNSLVAIEKSIINQNTAYAGGAIKTHHDSSIILDYVIINNNSAYYGGAVHTHFTFIESRGKLIITNNSAALGIFVLLYSSGLIKEGMTLMQNTGSLFAFNSDVKLNGETVIASNKQGQNFTVDPEVQEGGGITAILSWIHLSGLVSVEHNNASNGGAILAVTSRIILRDNISLSRNSAFDTGGAAYVYHSEFVISGCLLVGSNMATNRGGGIHSVSSSLILIHDDVQGASPTYVHFVSNTATLGGGICLEVSSKLYLITKCRLVHFRENRAEYGGAIYIADETNNGTCTGSQESITAASESECFFQSVTPSTQVMMISQLFSFYKNAAKSSGSVLYGGLMDRCTVKALTNRHIRYSSLPGFMNNIIQYTSSDAVRVCFCKESQIDCSFLPKPIQVMKGESFSIEVVAVDQVNNSLSGTIHSYLSNKESSFSDGQWSQIVKSTCTNLTFEVYSFEKNEYLNLYAKGPCNNGGISKRTVKVEFSNCSCPIGFEVSKIKPYTCQCDCDSELKPFVSGCNSTTSLLIRKGNGWIDKIWLLNKSYFITYKHCPFDYCIPASQTVSVNLNVTHGADAQCAFNRSGLICGKCAPGLSLSLGSTRCLICKVYWPALFVVIIVVAAISGLALVIFLLYLNLTVAIGTLNASIFYANIMHAYMSILMPSSSQEPNFYTAFIAWMNLDLGLDLCFINEMDMYIKTWVQLVFPIYVILLVFIVIFICEISTKFSNFVGRRNPVATLATLILFSYTKLLQSIIVSLSFGNLKYPNHTEVVWLPDASVKYLQGKHIPLFIVAIVILLLSIAYTFVLISWQLLVRFSSWNMLRWVKNTKMISFMDAYNAPYRSKFRCWTGLLLLARVVLYLVSALNSSKEPKVMFVSLMIVMCTLLALSIFQIYKNCILNMLEVATFYNIIIVSVIQVVVYEGSSTAGYTSVSISFLTLICIIVYHIFTAIPIRRWILRYINNCLSQDSYPHLPTTNCPNINIITHTEVGLDDEQSQLHDRRARESDSIEYIAS